MKRQLPLALCAFLLAVYSCAPDAERYTLDIVTQEIAWRDLDHSMSKTVGDAVHVYVVVQTTNPDHADQFITRWRLSYALNGQHLGVLTGDENVRSNSVTADLDIALFNLDPPGIDNWFVGDQVDFLVSVEDNYGNIAQLPYRFVVQE